MTKNHDSTKSDHRLAKPEASLASAVIAYLLDDTTSETYALIDEKGNICPGDTFIENARRNPAEDLSQIPGYVMCHDVSVDFSEFDNGPAYRDYVFIRGDEIVLVNMEVPDYCDDETDAVIHDLQTIESPEELIRILETDLRQQVQGVLDIAKKRLSDFSAIVQSVKESSEQEALPTLDL